MTACQIGSNHSENEVSETNQIYFTLTRQSCALAIRSPLAFYHTISFPEPRAFWSPPRHGVGFVGLVGHVNVNVVPRSTMNTNGEDESNGETEN